MTLRQLYTSSTMYVSSTGQFINWTFHQPGHFINRDTSSTMDTLSTRTVYQPGHFINRDISSTGQFINQDSLSTKTVYQPGHFVNWTVHQPGHFINRNT